MEEMLRNLISQAVQEAIAPLVQEVRELKAEQAKEQALPQDQGDPQVIGVGEAAAMLRCSKASIGKWMNSGELKFFIPKEDGKHRKTRRDWVMEFMERRARAAI